MVEILYHGSPFELEGEFLLPQKPNDISGVIHHQREGIYASPIRGIAIAGGIISCPGVELVELRFNKFPYGMIYFGQHNQEDIFLYHLSRDTFEPTGKNYKQWLSEEPVKPLDVEVLSIDDFIPHLVRYPTLEESEQVFIKLRNEGKL